MELSPPRLDAMQFDLTVYRTEDGYFVRVLDSPAGDTVEAFQQPLLAREIEGLRQAIAALDTGDEAAWQATRQIIQDLGERLFRALFPKSLYALLKSSYRMAYQNRAQLRIRLRLAEAPELISLPWEYIYDGERDEFPILSHHSPLIRYTDLMHHIPPLKVDLPLQMLVLIAAPAGYPAINRTKLWHTLIDSLDYLALEQRLRVEQLQKPTLFNLQRRLRERDCHILQIISYGSYDEYTEDGIIMLEDEMGRSRPVSGQHLGALLRDHFPLRLVALNTLDQLRPTRPSPPLAAGQSLIRRGVPAVVAVQSALDMHSTRVFAQQFYTQIADFIPVDMALTETRRALEATSASAAWGLPALLTRTPDGVLFRDPTTVTPRATATASRLRDFHPFRHRTSTTRDGDNT